MAAVGPMDWTLYLGLAVSLSGRTEPDDACLRSAISRAYYSAFHHARLYVKRHYKSIHLKQTGEDHDIVWNALAATGRHRAEINASVKGQSLRMNRNRADYWDHYPELRFKVREAIEDARAICSSLNAAGDAKSPTSS